MKREHSIQTHFRKGTDTGRRSPVAFRSKMRDFCSIPWPATVLLLCFSLLTNSCLKEDDATVLLPLPVGTIVGVDIPEGLLDHVQINEGTNPPSIEGYYMATPVQIEYASDNYWNAEYYNLYMAFSATEGRNNVAYRERQNNSTGSSTIGRIIGDGDDFTLYFTSTMKDDNEHWSCKTLTIISGSVAEGGIAHFQYANAMLEKEDPNHHIMEVGEYHVLHDGDEFVDIHPW